MGLKKIARFFSRVYAGGMGLKAFGLLCSMLLLVAGGCGQPTETGKAYYNPTWGADGRIYAIKEVIKTYRQGGLSPSTSQQRESYLVVMNGDGSDEQEIKFVGVERYPKLNASPLGNYLAMYRDGVEILDIHNGYKHIHTIDVDNTFFDWSPDEGKLIFRINGEKLKDMASLNLVYAWKYSHLIIGQLNRSRIVNEDDVVINEGGGGAVGYFPDGDTYLGLQASGRYDTLTTQVVETYPTLNTELSKESGVYNIQVNPVNAGEVMFSGPGYDALSASYPRQGIFLINLDGSNKMILRR